MIVIEGLKVGPVKGDVCVLTLYGEESVIEHFEDKALLVGKWKVLKTHGRLIDADELKKSVKGFATGSEVGYLRLIDNAPTILEASND